MTTNILQVPDVIPITPEILEKNGFGYSEEDVICTHYYPGEKYYLENSDLHIGTDRKGNYWINTRLGNAYGIHYIHELQNAFRLFKIEKEIIL